MKPLTVFAAFVTAAVWLAWLSAATTHEITRRYLAWREGR